MIVTHNMQQAARVSEDTAFFNLAGAGKPGQLIEMNPTKKIFSQPRRGGHRGLHLGPVRLSRTVPVRPAVSYRPQRVGRDRRTVSTQRQIQTGGGQQPAAGKVRTQPPTMVRAIPQPDGGEAAWSRPRP